MRHHRNRTPDPRDECNSGAPTCGFCETFSYTRTAHIDPLIEINLTHQLEEKKTDKKCQGYWETIVELCVSTLHHVQLREE